MTDPGVVSSTTRPSVTAYHNIIYDDLQSTYIILNRRNYAPRLPTIPRISNPTGSRRVIFSIDIMKRRREPPSTGVAEGISP